MTDNQIVIQVAELANGEHCPIAGQFLKEFDHEANNGRGFGVYTNDLNEAMKFDNFMDAMEFWKRQSKTKPRREDGKPNRPFTSTTVVILSQEQAKKDLENGVHLHG